MEAGSVSKQRTKGTQFESLILEGIQAYIPDAHRLGMQGAKDCGDIWLPRSRRYIVECKNEQRMDLAGWAKEAQAEANNAEKPFWVIAHKRRGSNTPYPQWITTTLYNWLEMTLND